MTKSIVSKKPFEFMENYFKSIRQIILGDALEEVRKFD